MCLAVPGKVLEVREENELRMAKVQYGEIVRDACLACVPEAEAGDYVIVHAGFAISKLDAQEAERTYELLREMGAGP